MSSREYRRDMIKLLQQKIDEAHINLNREIDPHVPNLAITYIVSRKECEVSPFGMCTFEKQTNINECIFCKEVG